MPIYAGNYGGKKVLGLTKTTDQQQEIQTDTIFHSSLPYVRVIEHTLTSFTNVQDKMWVQEYDQSYWSQTPNGSSLWWCGQRFPLPAAFIDSLQNTTRGFMVFVHWNDGWWEPLITPTMEHDPLYTWDNSNNFTMQQNLDVANTFRDLYGLSKYSTQVFIPRRRINGQNKVDPNAYATKVVILELVGLDVSTNGTITVTPQNPYQNNTIFIDDTQLTIGWINVMQEKYLQLMTNVTRANASSKTHNVQQDMIYPSSISYGMPTMDLVSSNRTSGMGQALPRNSPPIIFSNNVTNQPLWDVIDPLNLALRIRSLTNNWTKMTPDGFQQLGGTFIPRLSDPNNQTTYITQSQQVRRDDFVSRSMTIQQRDASYVMQVGVLNGNKFGTGIYMDSRRPQIGRGSRELFSPQTQGVARVGPTRRFNTPREQVSTGGMGQDVTIYQFHSKQVLTSITLSQQEQASNTFIVSMLPQYNPSSLVYGQGFNTQLNTKPQTNISALRRTKRSNQDQQLGYTIQGQTVSDNYDDTWVTDLVGYSGVLRAPESTRQVYQISLPSGYKFIIQDNEQRVSTVPGYTGVVGGIIHYIERSGNTINLVSETFINQNIPSSFSLTGSEGLFAGGYSIGLAQVL